MGETRNSGISKELGQRDLRLPNNFGNSVWEAQRQRKNRFTQMIKSQLLAN